MKTPFTYLGQGNHRRSMFCERVIGKIMKRLDGWKGKYLSMTNMIFLLSSVIKSLSLSHLSFFKMSIFAMKTIKKIQRQIL